ncbi:SUV3 C-terminal domain-containing protein [Microvirga aerilata]|uniref:SUV3 domain-containing protein n=1 Tax=Microvirga aerilata TaxID=670292 RepID=UPI003628C89E
MKLAVELLLDWARQHARFGRVQAPDFGVNTDLLKLEARVKIATSWLWLAQRYPDVFEDVEAVVDLRATLNAKIEEKLVATSVSHRRKPDEKSRRDRGKKPQRQRKNRRSWADADPVEVEQRRVRGQ